MSDKPKPEPELDAIGGPTGVIVQLGQNERFEANYVPIPRAETARLPENYQEAKRALAALDQLDEVKEWSDRAAAIASYARQVNDYDLEDRAKRIRARAQRRLGELLGKYPAAPQGGDRRSDDFQNAASHNLKSARQQAAEEAGLSGSQVRTALSIANMPEEDFEAAVEASPAASVTNLADWKKRETPAEHNRVTTSDAMMLALIEVLDILRSKVELRRIANLKDYGTIGEIEGLAENLRDKAKDIISRCRKAKGG